MMNRAANEKSNFTPFLQMQSFLTKDNTHEKLGIYPVDHFPIFRWLLSLKKTFPTMFNVYVCFSHYMQFLGSIVLLAIF